MTIDQQKSELRQQALSRRMQISLEARKEASKRITDLFFEKITLPPKDAIISGYSPINAEVDPREIISRLNKMGYTTTLPAPMDNEQRLAFLRWDENTKMRMSIYGIPEPDTDDTLDEFVPDFLIMPLLAFDAQGHRLGYGSGNFDRSFDYIRKTKKFTTVAVAFEAQKFPNVPVGAHDWPMDAVVTEENVYFFEGKK